MSLFLLLCCSWMNWHIAIMYTATIIFITLSYTTLFRSPGADPRVAARAGRGGAAGAGGGGTGAATLASRDRKSTRLNSSHTVISYAVFCLKKKNGQKAASVGRDEYASAAERLSD